MTITIDLPQHLRNYIVTHQTIQQMNKELKDLKTVRSLLEQEISEYLIANNIDVVNVANFRIYRYENRLMLYHCKANT